jgi:hypothetical protein
MWQGKKLVQTRVHVFFGEDGTVVAQIPSATVLPSASAHHAAVAMRDYVLTNQACEVMHTDPGTEFFRDFKADMERMNIIHRITSPGASQANGVVENLNGRISKAFRAIAADTGLPDTQLLPYLPVVMEALRSRALHTYQSMPSLLVPNIGTDRCWPRADHRRITSLQRAIFNGLN